LSGLCRPVESGLFLPLLLRRKKHPLTGLTVIDHHDNLLKQGKEKHAWGIINEFFDFFDEDSAKEYLWYMLTNQWPLLYSFWFPKMNYMKQ
jgi:hypothetical protein